MATSYKANIDGPAVVIGDIPAGIVKLWDLGPVEPGQPVKPTVPQGKEGSLQYDLDVIEFRGALATYELQVKAYGQAKRDFADWHKTYGGPYELERQSPDARDALANDPKRYCVSDKRLPNNGLPKGRKPGPWHFAEQERQQDRANIIAREIARDPVFGQGAVQ